jgi:hypothetical protein
MASATLVDVRRRGTGRTGSQAARHSILPAAADGSSPRAASSVARHDREGPRHESGSWGEEYLALTHDRPGAAAYGAKSGLVTFRRAPEVPRWLERAGRIRAATHRTPASACGPGALQPDGVENRSRPSTGLSQCLGRVWGPELEARPLLGVRPGRPSLPRAPGRGSIELSQTRARMGSVWGPETRGSQVPWRHCKVRKALCSAVTCGIRADQSGRRLAQAHS